MRGEADSADDLVIDGCPTTRYNVLWFRPDFLHPTQEEGIRMAMRLTRNLGMLLLAIWLILGGVVPLLNLSFSGLGTLMAILAIAAGVCIVIGR
jgi:hypothetical protein